MKTTDMKSPAKKKKKLEKGDRYFFVDTDFRYIKIPVPEVKKRTIYKVIGDEFSTKEEGDRFEVIQHLYFESEEKAKKHALRQLKEYGKYLKNELANAIQALES